MKSLMKILLFLIVCSTFAQTKSVKLEILNENNNVNYYVINDSEFPYEATLKLLDLKRRPIIKKVNPQSKTLFLSLRYKKSNSYRCTISSKIIVSQQVKESHTLTDFSKINEGIVIFDKIACPRCNKATAFLLDNNIPFKSCNIDNEENNRKMWEILNENGVGSRIITPVFLVNGELSYSHPDLDGFLESLKER